MQESVSRSMSRTPDGISDQFGAQSSGLRARQTEIRADRAPKTREKVGFIENTARRHRWGG